MGILFYFIKEAFRGFYQAKWMTLISVTIISITLFFMGSIYLLFVNINLKLDDTVKQSTVNVFIKDSYSSNPKKLSSISTAIDRLDDVLSYQYFTKDAAIKKFRTLYGSKMLDAVSENPLPASFELVLNRNLDIESLKGELKLINGIESVQYSKEWLSRLKNFQDIFLKAIIAVFIILIFVLYFIISNTIRLTIYARRDLVMNMHYVGATEFFIKAPFILEGILQGVIGGSISIVVITLIKLLFTSLITFWGAWYFYPLLLTVGGLFGWMGSAIAVRKSLN